MSGKVIRKPRKKKRGSKRPLEDVPLRQLVKHVREELKREIKMAAADADKPKKD